MIIIDTIAKGMVIIALIFVYAAMIGLFRFKNFYARILITSKVEILGSITMMIGIALCSGLHFFTWKVILIMWILMITNPLAAHSIARSAYKSGHEVKGEKYD